MSMAQTHPSAAPHSIETGSSVQTADAPHPARVPSSPTPLSAGQEAQVRDLYYARVRAKCAEEILQFALCARTRTVTAPFACRAQRHAMNGCMVAHATREEQDRAREEWFLGAGERRHRREEEEREREEGRRKKGEWWRDYVKERTGGVAGAEEEGGEGKGGRLEEREG